MGETLLPDVLCAMPNEQLEVLTLALEGWLGSSHERSDLVKPAQALMHDLEMFAYCWRKD